MESTKKTPIFAEEQDRNDVYETLCPQLFACS